MSRNIPRLMIARSRLAAFLFRCAFAASLCCLLEITTLAQSGRQVPPSPAEKPIVKVETHEVLLPLNAYDARGKSVEDLKPKELIVVEDGAPRTITSLKREPANIVLVLDLCNEIGTFKNGPREWNRPLGAEPEELPEELWKHKKPLLDWTQPATRELANNFVAQVPESDYLAIIQYAEKVELIQDWTRDRTAALAAIRSKYRVGLKSSYYDALTLAAEKLRERPSGRRVIVLVTDGIDTVGRTRHEQALAAVTHARASVFVIGWADLLQQEIGKTINWKKDHEPPTTKPLKRQNTEKPSLQLPQPKILSDSKADRLLELRKYLAKLDGAAAQLRQLAEASGGEIWMPESFAKFVTAHAGVIKEIGTQYTLAFMIEREPSLESLHTVEVFPARPGLTVRARRIYYAE